MNQTDRTYKSEKCAWCKGTGKWNVAPGNRASCIVCGGKGKVSVTQPSISCRHCQGGGSKFGIDPCYTCAGTGWEQTAEQSEISG